MQPLDKQFAASIDNVSRALAEWTVQEMFERKPDFEKLYPADGRALWKGEIINRLQFLAEAIAADCPEIFVQSVEWARAGFMARGFETAHLAVSLEMLSEVLRSELPTQVADRACAMIEKGLVPARRKESPRDDAVLVSAFTHDGVDAKRAQEYLNNLLERHQARAVDVLLEAVRSGKSVAQVYETVIAPALAEVGRLWHINEATVADEHYVTTATQNAMAVLRMKLPKALPNGKRALAASIGGDLHDVGIRMVADLLASEGWQVDCLGANMPTGDLVAAVDQHLAADVAADCLRHPRDLQPLPLLGIPGLTPESEDPAFYEDTWQFRPGRRRPAVAPQASQEGIRMDGARNPLQNFDGGKSE